MTIRELQQFQNNFDSELCDNESRTEQMRAATADLASIVDKLTICNRSQSAKQRDYLQQEVIPELLMISLRLANLCDSELESLYFNKLLELDHTKQKKRLLTLSEAAIAA